MGKTDERMSASKSVHPFEYPLPAFSEPRPESKCASGDFGSVVN